ncbi:hypothetical protein VIGAN_01168000, partial [Vigna angularis var. angularis]
EHPTLWCYVFGCHVQLRRKLTSFGEVHTVGNSTSRPKGNTATLEVSQPWSRKPSRPASLERGLDTLAVGRGEKRVIHSSTKGRHTSSSNHHRRKSFYFWLKGCSAGGEKWWCNVWKELSFSFLLAALGHNSRSKWCHGLEGALGFSPAAPVEVFSFLSLDA